MTDLQRMQRIQALTDHAREKLELDERDETYVKNRLLEISDLDAPENEDEVYGALSLTPSAIDGRFKAVFETEGSKAATDWLYRYCVNNKYVKKDVLDKNPRFSASNGLIVTINKAKPEFKDPQKARSGNSVDGGFAKCVICRENEGFAPRKKRNLRTVSITLGGKEWFWQYSPYGYFNEHGIAVNCEHTPMHVDKQTFINLMDFTDIFPHYFIGCNAPLPRIGGSVLAHDHYQGGGEVLPMQTARIKTYIKHGKYPDTTVGIVDWPSNVIRIVSKDRQAVTDISEAVRKAWLGYDDRALGIVSEDDDGMHNAVSPTVVKTASGYEMNIILRSNITSDRYPDGVFHAHPEYHAVKKESIGLIEAQGLFILPGRLENELVEIERCIENNAPLPDGYGQFKLVYDEAKALYDGKCLSVRDAVREELGSICYRILQNTAVFEDERDFICFLQRAGFTT